MSHIFNTIIENPFYAMIAFAIVVGIIALLIALRQKTPFVSFNTLQNDLRHVTNNPSRQLEVYVYPKGSGEPTSDDEQLGVSSYRTRRKDATASYQAQPEEPAASSVPTVSGYRTTRVISGVQPRFDPTADTTDETVEKKTALN
jgi:hypothetical protein